MMIHEAHGIPLMLGRMTILAGILVMPADGRTGELQASDASAGGTKNAVKPATAIESSKVYLLVFPDDKDAWKVPPPELHWKELHRQLDEKAARLIRIVPRDQVDESVFVDFEGLRLYADGPKCRQVWRSRITASYHIRTLLMRLYAKTGIEPDRIPVHGEAGKKLGTKNMVLIKAGEYVRTGHYYTSQSAILGERRGDRYRVKVAAFYIDKYKVTNEDYCRFLNDGNPGYWNSIPWSNIKRDESGRFTVDP
ncbi:MAG: hypothetical protein D6725_00570, partial [Planctomycetota bacterium]